MTSTTSKLPPLQFPSQGRVWLITAAISPIGVSLIRRVLAHGDSVIAGIHSKGEMCGGDDGDGDGEVQRTFWEDVVQEGWNDRIRIVSFDGRCERFLFQCGDEYSREENSRG